MTYQLVLGDCLERLKELPSNSVQCIVSSPPYYGLRNYGVDGQIGLEETPQAYIAKLVEVFREARRVLKDDGVLWLNLGDSYNGSGGAGGDYGEGGLKEGQPKYKSKGDISLKPKDLMMIPARVAIALQDDGWWVRSEIVWTKPNPMPESVADRPTKAHEMIYLLTKSARYFYDQEAVREANSPTQPATGVYVRKAKEWAKDYSVGPMDRGGNGQNDITRAWYVNGTGRNLRSVWNIATRPFTEAHFATFPVEIPLRCIKAGTSERGECPHCGKAWVRVVERESVNHISRFDRQIATGGAINGGVGKNFPDVKLSTIGFTPQCQCPPHEPVPQTVLDPFNGAATTGVAALLLNRKYIGIELNPDYLEISRKRLQNFAIEMPSEILQPKVIKQQIAMF